MNKGAQVALASVAAFVLAIGVEVAYLHHKRAVEENEPAVTKTDNRPRLAPDDLVFLKKKHPDSLKDERALIGTTIWVSAGGQMDYYKDSGNHVDYARPVDTLKGAVPLLIKGVFEQVPPKTGRAVARIAAGQRHVLLAFTMPSSTDPKQLYAVPVGHFADGSYEFLTDEIFFYDDPHELYKHWGPEVWAHVDKHEVALGMTENQCMMALGQVIDPHGDTMGERSVTYNNDGHPITIDFEGGKAVKISKDS
ncbi:MAG: hypothetical protein PW735_08815 [Acidobacteriaceae bacterium]|nr:hypothetical protein [Acidobacteriaceae bacterium]